MAVFFNNQLLEELAQGDPNKYLALLEYHSSGKLAPSRYSKYKPAKQSLAGGSFLLNPISIFRDNVTDTLFRVQYVKLAARRDYTLYKFHKVTGIQLSYYPDINIEAAKQNPLLIVTPQQINFKYEK